MKLTRPRDPIIIAIRTLHFGLLFNVTRPELAVAPLRALNCITNDSRPCAKRDCRNYWLEERVCEFRRTGTRRKRLMLRIDGQ